MGAQAPSMEERSAFAVFDSPVGRLYGRADDGALTALCFASGRPVQSLRGREYKPSRDAIAAVEAQVGEYFIRRRTTFDVPLALVGPPFHVRVWEALRAIPYGTTVTYGELAQSIGEADSARAVGAANGANPIVIIVPCHRVIGANGRLVGFGGGLPRKRALLDLESGRITLDLAPCAASHGIFGTRPTVS